MKQLGIISTQVAPWGGSEEIWAEVALAARARGLGVRACVTENCRGVPRVAELTAAGVEFRFRPEAPVARPGLPGRAFNRLRRAAGLRPAPSQAELRWADVFAHRPDALLICQGGPYCGTGLPGLPGWLRGAGIPHVVLCQSARPHRPLEDGLREQARAYYAGASRVGFVSLGNRDEVQLQLASAVPNHFLFQNPIAFAPSAEVPWPESDVPLLSCPARFNIADKGQDLLLQVLARPAWRERQYRCVLFGGGPDEGFLRQLVNYLGLEARVSFGGETQGTLPIWQQTQLMVLPSRSEGLSLVLLEAMAAGRGIATTAVGGHAEWLRDPADGFLAPASSVADLAAALERAWAARGAWRQHGQSARERFLKLYDPAPAATMLDVLAAVSRAGVPALALASADRLPSPAPATARVAVPTR